ncbi:MAG: transcription-repair coupling factor [Bacteroidales bacterium]|jgi:transcription-repair coupling factor (superfamily II helicase)|nr:transcription-repair coupling factor [Bacteroidales bacterium]
MSQKKDINIINPYVKNFVIEATKPNANIVISGLRGSSFAFFLNSVANQTIGFTNFVVFKDFPSAAAFYNDMAFLSSNADIYNNVLFYGNLTEAEALLAIEEARRSNSKYQATTVITYYECLFEKVIGRTTFSKNTIDIEEGQTLDLDFLLESLDNLHFERVDFVYDAGQYALRGGIIDVFSFSNREPHRIELFEDKVESIRTFDIVSQLSIEEKNTFSIVPNVKDGNLSGKQTTIIDYFEGENTLVWIEKIDDLNKKANETGEFEKNIVNKIYQYNLIKIEINANNKNKNLSSFAAEFHTELQPHFNQSLELLFDNLVSYYEKGFRLMISVTDKKQEERLKHIFAEFIQTKHIEDSLHSTTDKINYLPLQISYIDYSFSSGFIDFDTNTLLYTDHQIFSRVKNFKVRDTSTQKERLLIEDLTALKPGDYVTHIDYGIGKFAGLEKITGINGRQQESIRLIYKDGDVLYVSIHALHKIARYVGGDGSTPKVSRLGSNKWEKLKEKTKGKVKDIAKELIILYAKRKSTHGFAFSADNYLQNSLEASFIYEDTPDQHKASIAVKRDMESSAPMDRLICGDVGFGKTEIAIRAAFKAACDGKQTAVLVPTTILALQHYKTFSERLKDFPVTVDYLNRFRTTKEKKTILNNLKSGKTDIIIGTHSLVYGKKNEEIFKDLGLLIIDEEHKFGVSIKEKLKELKVNVDTLTLTATPIPRTLQFSLMGARDLSIINTPPANRLPVQTQLSTFNEQIIKQAIEYELDRNGQVFIVNDKIIGLEALRQIVEQQVPQAKVCVAHAQLPNDELENVMLDFIEGNFDVLISTTIVENGLDVSNANTIIINHANNYGLSDLHQLRGRVGRTNRRAFCYLFVNDKEILTEQAEKRLRAIEELTSLGSGFSIAMRDLDIRGAGNILGSEQSGFINEVGFETYNKILNEAITELNYELQINYHKIETDVTIETDLEALLPDTYISNTTERLKIYKELDSISNLSELDKIASELKDRFGEIPKETLLLFDIVRLRQKAKVLSIEKLVLKNNKMIIYFLDSEKTDFYSTQEFQRFLLLVQSYPKTCTLKEDNNRIIATFANIKTLEDAEKILNF